MDGVRWGIAGTGMIAGAMARCLAEVEGAQVVAVGSRTAERAEAFAAEHDLARAHGSYDALAADDEVDVVYVATPHSHHLEHAVACLEAGRHVLCEKPLAVNADQAGAMADAAGANGRFLMEAMWTWFIPAIIEVRDRVAAGDIGEVRAIRADFGLRIDATEGRLVEPALAGGSTLDMGIYPVALTRLLLGPPDSVQAVGRLGDTGVDVNVGAVLGHPGGAVATFHTSLQTTTSLTAEVTGTEGRIALEAPFWAPSAYTLTRDGQPERFERPHRGLAHEVEHVHERLRGGHTESDVVTLADSVAMAGTLDAIRAAVGVRYPGEG